MEIALKMSIESFTPVPYWLSKTLKELTDWMEVFINLQKRKG
jgi:hypothetical protein